MKKCIATETQLEICRGWGTEFLYICFNDDCPYFVKGWDWMRKKYQRGVSYRHAYNPATGKTFPIPVASPAALKETIIVE